eukprot:365603-Chlamydomonas_euryale.AAC.18
MQQARCRPHTGLSLPGRSKQFVVAKVVALATLDTVALDPLPHLPPPSHKCITMASSHVMLRL